MLDVFHMGYALHSCVVAGVRSSFRAKHSETLERIGAPEFRGVGSRKLPTHHAGRVRTVESVGCAIHTESELSAELCGYQVLMTAESATYEAGRRCWREPVGSVAMP